MRKFKHTNTGIERELKVGNALISVLESSPSWEALTEPKEDPEPTSKAKK